MLGRVLVLCLLAAGVSAFADAPDWVHRGKSPDKTYKYYLGRSSGTATEQAGFNEATREAYEQAIRENFGFQTRIQSDAYESSKSVVSTKRVQLFSQDIRVFGFEQVDFYRQANGEKFDVWVLYRYPLAEIAREKSRLATSRGEKTTEFSEQGSAEAAQKSGILEISTKPPGAAVYIDGASYGVSPMRLKGVIEAGRHMLRLDHPAYETVEESILLAPGKTLRVDKPLVPALARLSVTTEPSNANVVINGQQLGTTPLADLEVPANKPLKIEITHAESNPLAVDIEVAKDEFNAKHFDLPLKNAALLVRSTPSGAEVFIDGQRVGVSPVGPKTLMAGRHNLRLHKSGFQDERMDLQLRGGEKRIVDDVKLLPSKGGSEPAIWSEFSQAASKKNGGEKDPPALVLSFWLPQFGSSMTEYPAIPHAAWGLSLTFLLKTWLALELGYFFGTRAVEYSDSVVTLSSSKLHLGLPLLIWRSENQHFYISPDLDYAMNRYTLRYTADTLDRFAPGQSQLGYGASVGYRHWWGDVPALALGLRLGIMKYGSAVGIMGATSYTGGVECAAVF